VRFFMGLPLLLAASSDEDMDAMVETDVAGLEASIKELPGVLGCVVLPNPDGSPAEIQAFTEAGISSDEVQAVIHERAGELGLQGALGQVFVMALEAEAHPRDDESLQRAAELAEQEARARGPLGVLHALGTLHSLVESSPEGATPPLNMSRLPFHSVRLGSSTWGAEAEVTLEVEGRDVVGRATGDKSPHGLPVVAQATLDAVGQMASGCRFHLVGASLISTMGRDAVVVVVREPSVGEGLGAALVRSSPVAEVAVRATLDAVNRRLAAAR
jgi:hypothetical protein